MKQCVPCLILFVVVGITISSCNKSSTQADNTIGNWVTRSTFDGVGRNGAITFTIGDTAYVGTGYGGNALTGGTAQLGDMWKYDVDHNYWIQRASLPTGAGRREAVAFSTSTKGYITTGYDGVNKLKDTWEFDPSQNAWTKKADFPGAPRVDAVAFGLNNKGYVTTGNDNTNTDVKDFWMYDPATDAWTQKTSLGGTKRSGATSFVYNNQAYVVGGTNGGAAVTDFWMYDPTADKWTEKRAVANLSTDTYDDSYGTLISRSGAVAIVIGDKAYLCTGILGGALQKSVWQYDFATDLWVVRTPWEGLARTQAIGFTLKNRGFLGLGKDNTYYFDDFREFLPTETYDAND
ncbi:MAG: kelch repeat-containing protein [Chitinophagaceae bacterium]